MDDSKNSLAVAYAMKKRNKRKMASGGIVDPPEGSLDGEADLSATESEALASEDSASENEDIVEAIMHKRKLMAKGGQVLPAGNTDTVTEPVDAWSGHGDDDLKENYASDLSDDLDDQTVVGQILRDRKRKRG